MTWGTYCCCVALRKNRAGSGPSSSIGASIAFLSRKRALQQYVPGALSKYEFCGSFPFRQLSVQTFAIPDICTDFSRKVLGFTAISWQGEPKNTEPDKPDDVRWLPLNDLPHN